MNTSNLHAFGDRLADEVRRKRSAICVGLDPRAVSLPQGFLASLDSPCSIIADAYRKFCCEVIDVVAPLVGVIKPQVAFFEQLGPHGMVALGEVIAYAISKDLLVIADAKRNDIGTTAEAYAAAYLGRGDASAWKADSLTVSPYLGDDSLQPFVDRCHATSSGIFVLVKTSNPGSGFMQDLSIDHRTISQRVADWVQAESLKVCGSSGYGAIGAVVGATYPNELIELRQRMPNAWLLIPGYGAQGGGAKDVKAAFDKNGLGAVINNSRGILFAHQSARYQHLPSWQAAVEAATADMNEALKSETAMGAFGSN
ncbi:MAG: orotidine-5'-phosphate decarboxylase [Pirellulaceae bacterium]|nr:orotidine-5'-phosphate decarboxylase [Pirellulaceae bacterium]